MPGADAKMGYRAALPPDIRAHARIVARFYAFHIQCVFVTRI